MEYPSASSSSKTSKARGNNNIMSQVVAATAHCLVDGCNADLSLCKDYHRRHKVCEVHSKTSKVIIGGKDQRFCQQCSRFHSLVEFDEGKRSCRKRLDGHNRRRRKPHFKSLAQRHSIIINSHSSVLSARPKVSGPRILSFNSIPQISLPSTTVVSSSSWSDITRADHETMLFSTNQMNFMERPPTNSYSNASRARCFVGVNNDQLCFLHGDKNQFQIDPTTTNVVFSGSMDTNRAVGSDHAPSLLSSAPTPITTIVAREFGVSQQQLMVDDLHRYSSGLGHFYAFGQETATSVVSIAESSSHGSCNMLPMTLNFPRMFQHEGEGYSSGSVSHQTALTFTWE